jgi:hypothetical protein
LFFEFRCCVQAALPLVEMSDGEDFELETDVSFDFTENENDAAWMTLHVTLQIMILIAAHVHKSAPFVLFALISQVTLLSSAKENELCTNHRLLGLPQVLMLLVFIKAKGLTDEFGNALITVCS